MSSTLMAKGSRRALAQIRYVTPVYPDKAEGLVARVYAQAERDFGMVAPPVALHSRAPAVLTAAWAMLRETLLAPGQATRLEKEVVAAAVSAANECPYCVTVHTAVARRRVRDGQPDLTAAESPASPSSPLEEIARWSRTTGLPGPGQHAAGRGIPVGKLPELAGVAVTFHYLNRMVSVFLPDSPLPSQLPKFASGAFLRVLGSMMFKSNLVPGDALDLMPPAPLAAEFSWAAGEPRVAETLSRAAAVVGEAGAQTVPAAVRELVQDRLRDWDGRPPALSRAWVQAAVAGLAEADRAAGRLALLTAFAPYQVSQDDIGIYRAAVSGPFSGDEATITLTAWASMAAARTVSTWLAQPSPDAVG